MENLQEMAERVERVEMERVEEVQEPTSIFFIMRYNKVSKYCKRKLYINKHNYSQFHKTLVISSLQMHWISVRFYEMGDRKKG